MENKTNKKPETQCQLSKESYSMILESKHLNVIRKMDDESS